MNINTVLKILVQTLLPLLSPAIFKSAIDKLLDEVERLVKESTTPIDNIVVLPVIAIIRSALDIPQDSPIDPNIFTPGDYNERMNTVKNKYLQQYNLKESEVNWDKVDLILRTPGIWQTAIEKYFQSINDKKK